MDFDYRNKDIAAGLVEKIKGVASKLGNVTLMELCGTHTQVVGQYGIKSLLPDSVRLLSGPGCPVCVTTNREIDEAIALTEKQDTIVCSFGDLMRVRGSNDRSLSDARSSELDARVVYSISDAKKIAVENPGREVVHVAIGFETTAPSTACEILDGVPDNFSVLSCHRLFPPAMEALLQDKDARVNGFINPGHVSTIIGLKDYERLGEEYMVPQVVAGFEPLDVMAAILMLLEMTKNGDHSVKNEYTRVVKTDGNLKALKAMDKIFDTVDLRWRGFPVIKNSGLVLKKKYGQYDARQKFDLHVEDTVDDLGGCRCGDVLKGKIGPQECPLFRKQCNPNNPMGPCMVSTEGTCGITYKYG